MTMNTEQDNKVSAFYQSTKAEDGLSIQPLSSTDDNIRQAAVDAIVKDRKQKIRFLLPLSAAASILLVAGVVLKMAMFTNQSTIDESLLSNNKQPMYMLQRAKPVAAEVLVQQIQTLINENKNDQARSLYSQLQHRYPGHELEAELKAKLQ